MKAFSLAEADALAVVESVESQKVIGLLTGQHALRRYNEELDRRQSEPIPIPEHAQSTLKAATLR